VLALVAGACGGTTTPSASPGAASAAASEPAATTAPAESAATGQVEIRWYCCLGGGDAPEQVEVEQKVVDDFNASHPNIKLTFEAVPYAGANDALATEIASGNGPTSSDRWASAARTRSTASGSTWGRSSRGPVTT
jgi:ABC-type glycerol-3-phosphate transport system substrate-binding protein